MLAETFAHIALMCLLPQAAVDRFDLEREDFRYDVKEYDVRLRCGGQIYKFEVRNSNSYKTAIGEGYGSLDVLGAYVNKYKTRETLADYFIRPLLQSETLAPNFRTIKTRTNCGKTARRAHDAISLLRDGQKDHAGKGPRCPVSDRTRATLR